MTSIDEIIEKPLTFIRNKAADHAKAKSERVYLEQFRKSKKALLMVDAERQGIKTVAQQEAYAYSHDDYLGLLDGLKVAVEREEYLKTQINVAQLRIELFRTEQANQRAERSAYGA